MEQGDRFELLWANVVLQQFAEVCRRQIMWPMVRGSVCVNNFIDPLRVVPAGFIKLFR